MRIRVFDALSLQSETWQRYINARGLFAQECKASALKLITIEQVERIKRYQPLAVGMSDMDTSLANGSEIEAVGINELNDQHTEEVLIREIFRSQYLRQTTQQIAQGGGLCMG